MRVGGNRRPKRKLYRSSEGRTRRLSEMKWDRKVVRVMKQKNLTREEVVTRQNIAESDGEPVTLSKCYRQIVPIKRETFRDSAVDARGQARK